MTVTGARESDVSAAVAPRSRITRVLIAVIAVCVVAVALAGGYVWGSSGSSDNTSSPSTTSADAGFARDMATHHTQAVTMAGYERDNTTDPQLKLLAFDIETSQQFQIGEFQGWLDAWGLSRSTTATPMAWMAGHAHLQSNGLMPGMASSAELAKLESLHGKALDIFFLQLMIRHHQGGVAMASYAAQHVSTTYERTLAQSVVTAQSNEIQVMEQALRKLGGTPLPPPSQ